MRTLIPVVALASVPWAATGCGARSATVLPQVDASTQAVEAGAATGQAEGHPGSHGENPAIGPGVVPAGTVAQRRADACAVQRAATRDATGDDAGCHGVVICASDYDQSCATNSDCVGIGQGNTCFPCAIGCQTAAINKRDLGRYRTEVAARIPEIDAGGSVVCNCPAEHLPSCVQGTCE